jgi:hypothetical protein
MTKCISSEVVILIKSLHSYVRAYYRRVMYLYEINNVITSVEIIENFIWVV